MNAITLIIKQYTTNKAAQRYCSLHDHVADKIGGKFAVNQLDSSVYQVQLTISLSAAHPEIDLLDFLN